MVQIDTRLPMMIQQPNVLAALDAGTTAAANQANVLRQAEGQNLFRQYGAGAMQGDPRAMNALAGFDPVMAQNMQAGQLDMQATRQGMAIDRERIQMLRDETARALAAAEDQAEAMREAQEIGMVAQEAVRAFATRDEAGFARATASAFGQPLPMTEEGLAALAAFHEGAKAFMEMRPGQPEMTAEMQNLTWRAQQAGLKPGTPEYKDFIARGGAQPRTGTALSVTPEGGVTFTDGVPEDFRFTEGQGKDNVYATRAEGALALLDSVGADAMANRGAILADAVPLGLARGFQPEDFQVAQQAGNEFLQAILRKDTGAAITADEQALYGQTFLPQPGDGPQVLEAKRQARIRALEALKAGMNIQQLTVTERALIQAAERAGVAAPASSGAGQGRRAAPVANTPAQVEIDGQTFIVEPLE